jgi:signal transduction histidine kinase
MASGWVISLTALLALTGGLIIYRTSMRRVDTITRSSQAIMTGNLTHRLPLNGTGDELDRLSTSINQMLERIEQLLAGMKQVTSDIAHDLRTPLGRLRQKLELASESDQTDSKSKQVFQQAIAETNSILETFDALLRIGKIEAGTAAQHFADVDLSEMVAQFSESYLPVIEDNGQFITASIANGVHVNGDRRLLMQMLVNLLDNAVRHCGSGTRISLALGQDAETVWLTVADNGAGIPPEELPKIIRPFYRLERSRSLGGSGLGLALVNAIVHLHGIRLELADNAPGLKVTLTFAKSNPRIQ